MSKYFFLGSFLPPLKVGNKPDIQFNDLIELFKKNMVKADFEKISFLRSYIDLKNIQNLLKKQPLDSRGNYNEKELDEAILNRDGFENYLFEYLDEFETKEKQILHFHKLFLTFFHNAQSRKKGFLKRYFHFEREWKLILTAYRAKKLQRDLTLELQYEDSSDPLVAQIIAQKDSSLFEFPTEYEDLGESLKNSMDNPKKQYEIISTFRFNKVNESVQDKHFSIDFVLGYFVQHIIVEDYYSLNDKKGSLGLTEIIKGVVL